LWRLGRKEREKMDEPVKILVESTPDPNSLKFSLNRVVVAPGSESYGTPEEAEKPLLSKKLFAITGVKDLFFMKNFITLRREPVKRWEEIVPAVEKILREHFK
jgi:hypothetical protein